MALETLKGVKYLNNTFIGSSDDMLDGDDAHIFVNHEDNILSFKIQNGPVKEVGKNGCQVEDIVAVALQIVSELNKKFPCIENGEMIKHLESAIYWSKQRTLNREKRNVEGTSQS